MCWGSGDRRRRDDWVIARDAREVVHEHLQEPGVELGFARREAAGALEVTARGGEGARARWRGLLRVEGCL
jgi:hypothetical protein